ncbi:spore photoproduct lyase family protein [Kribbella sp. CA-293567]|uniref:spore photoproduct lyase family protein n=1 Tax=Kribbella sp. CA-293567 TaxID=3002436 RepID=UPI0022DDA664|nr:radical SAM protein [Kribbella sp. CA-293567]WBQ07936.1 radical SAM protein [Kribbella sp. CA-293567]
MLKPVMDTAARTRRPKLWTPKHVLVTRSAAERPHTREVLARVEAAGVTDVTFLRSDRISGLSGGDERAVYARAKATLAVVVSPPSARKLQPIAPSADWRLDLARGCPAHCQYCYLAGSLGGPPITRVYADLDEILAGMDAYVGHGRVTSADAARAAEGTTFEASCYTDPLGIEPVTGSLAAAISHVGTHSFDGPVQLRVTTKFGAVDELLDLPHGGRTRIRASVNAEGVAGRFEGGTDPVSGRLTGLGALARAGYPVGLTIAPIMPVEGWHEQYTELLTAAADALPADADLTVECITHRFTPGSKEVLESWYPRTKLEMDPERRSRKFGKFGAVKYVYPATEMRELRAWFTDALAAQLPAARSLYWT